MLRGGSPATPTGIFLCPPAIPPFHPGFPFAIHLTAARTRRGKRGGTRRDRTPARKRGLKTDPLPESHAMMPLIHNVDLPVRPQASGTRVERVAGGILLNRKTRPRFPRALLLFWLAGWTVTCALLVLLVRRDPRPVHFLFALPFWAFWFYVLYLMLDLAFGRECLRLTRNGLHYQRSALVPLKRRRVPIWQIGEIGNISRVADRESGRVEQGICIETQRRPILFAIGAPDSERLWLMQMIRAQFGLIEANDPDAPAYEAPSRPQRVVDRDVEPDSSAAKPIDVEASVPSLEEPEEILEVPTRSARRPLGSQWTTRRNAAGFHFAWQGRWRWRTIGTLLLLGSIAGGLVGLARAAFQQYPNGLIATLYAVTLLVCALLIGATLLAASLRFCRREWVLGHDEVITRLSIFGFCFANWYPVCRIARVVARRENRVVFHPDRDLRSTILGRLLGKDTSLVLLDDADRVVTKLRALTPDEARWIGSELRRTYAGKMGQLSA